MLTELHRSERTSLQLIYRIGRRLGIEWRKRTYLPPPDRALVDAMRRKAVASSEPRVVHVRQLGRKPVQLRPNTTDAGVCWVTFVPQPHLVPPEIAPESVRVIWDLGANIGLTMAHYAALYPQARIHGVELDPTTAAAAQRNIAPWRERCQLLQGALWHEDGEVDYHFEAGNEEAAHVSHASSGDPAHTRRAKAYSLNTLLAEVDTVDFIKFDIEGAEASVLTQNTEWAARVRSVKVEVHPPAYSLERCENDLRALGFETYRGLNNALVVTGIRRESHSRRL